MGKVFVSHHKYLGRRKKKVSPLLFFWWKKNDAKKILEKIRVLFLFSFFIFFFTIALIFLFQRTIFSPQYRLSRILFTKESLAVYNDMYMYSKIQNEIQGKNRYMYKFFFHRKLVDTIKKIYPFVQDIHVVEVNRGQIFLNVLFSPPTLVVQKEETMWGVYGKKYFYPIFSGNTIGSGIHILYLPRYLSWTTTLSWLFFTLPATQLSQHMDIIYDVLPQTEKIVYLAGSEKMVVLLDDWKKIFINNNKDVLLQLQKFLAIQKDWFRLYSWLSYTDVGQIDLGSLDHAIIKKR